MQLVTLAFCLITLASYTAGSAAFDFDVQCSRSGTCGNSWGIQLIGAAGGAGIEAGSVLNPNITCNQGDILNFRVSEDATNYPFGVQALDATNVQTLNRVQNPISTAGILSVQCQDGFYLSPQYPTMSGFIIASTGLQQAQLVQTQPAVITGVTQPIVSAQTLVQQPVVATQPVVAVQPVTVQERVITSPAQTVPVVQQVPVPVIQTVYRERVKVQPVEIIKQVPVPVVKTVVQEKVIKQPVIQPIIQEVTPEPEMVSFTEAPYTVAPFTQTPFTVAVPVTTTAQATVTPLVNTVVTPYITQPQTACAQTTIPQGAQLIQPTAEQPVLPVAPVQPVVAETVAPAVLPVTPAVGQPAQPGYLISSAPSTGSSILSILFIVSLFYMM